jgi:hypothetical protein
MSAAKYIKTRDNKIITFSAALTHSDFRDWDPISAGFISFGIKENGELGCSCYGDSFSLKLKSEPQDSRLAELQLLNKF